MPRGIGFYVLGMLFGVSGLSYRHDWGSGTGARLLRRSLLMIMFILKFVNH